MLQGILFDMDGVLIDSEHIICKAAVQLFHEKGVTVQPTDFLPFVGTGEDRYLGGVAEQYNIPLELEKDKKRLYDLYEEEAGKGIPPLNGVLTFITSCRQKGLKMAVATSADRRKMLINLKCIGLSEADFDTTVNGQDVEHKKPSPDIYLLASSKLNLAPANCLVIEDAVNGIEAGKAAGCRCLGLTTSFTAKQLELADWITTDLSAVPLEALNW